MFWFGDSNIVIISGLSKTLAFFYYAILALAKLKKVNIGFVLIVFLFKSLEVFLALLALDFLVFQFRIDRIYIRLSLL